MSFCATDSYLAIKGPAPIRDVEILPRPATPVLSRKWVVPEIATGMVWGRSLPDLIRCY